MADRYGFQFTKALVPEVFLLDGYMSAGPDGYVDVSNGTDVLPIWMLSITRNSTGNYTVVTTDTWASILMPTIIVVNAGASDHLVAQLLSTSQSGFTFVLENSTTGTATDLPTSGGLLMKLVVHNSTSL